MFKKSGKNDMPLHRVMPTLGAKPVFSRPSFEKLVGLLFRSSCTFKPYILVLGKEQHFSFVRCEFQGAFLMLKATPPRTFDAQDVLVSALRQDVATLADA